MIRVHALEHAASEGAGSIADWARERGHTLTTTRLDLGQPLPEVTEFDLLVIMGGAMNIYQYRDYPWLVDERKLIAAAVEVNKGVLGVCLGAQLLADVLGARVVQNPLKEIGWFPVRFLDPSGCFRGFPGECVVFHWHGDTFELPDGARCIAESDGCANQAFIKGDRHIGLQFHVEISREAVGLFVEGGQEELVPAQYVQTSDAILSGVPDLQGVRAALYTLLDRLAEAIEQVEQA